MVRRPRILHPLDPPVALGFGVVLEGVGLDGHTALSHRRHEVLLKLSPEQTAPLLGHRIPGLTAPCCAWRALASGARDLLRQMAADGPPG